MAFNAVQSNIYNYYLTTYKPGEVSKYDAHKKSDLRNLYNSMVKLNKESPLYLIPDAEEAARSAVDLKEMARSLHNSIAQLGGLVARICFVKRQPSLPIPISHRRTS